jgi:alcohol dehydrogenase class IV
VAARPLPSNTKCTGIRALASLFGGLALSNAKLGAAHGFAGPMGGMFPAPHGTICGRLRATAAAAVAWVQELCDALEVPPLSSYGVTEEDPRS